MLSCHQIDDIVKMKRNKMKKIVALVAVLFSVVVPVQSNASEQKSLVIIDSYFDSKVYSPTVKCVTISNAVCTDVVAVKKPSVSDEINHGNAMAEVAKKQSPSLSIVLLRSGTPSKNSVTPVNAGNFIEALRWVNLNSSTVKAVSVSRFFNANNGTCSPASTNTAPYGGVVGADKTIRELISTLKTKGIQVFASTGNKRGTKIDYPACILDTVSVGTGEVNLAGNIISSNAFDANTDYVATSSVYSYLSPVMNLIPQTTSSATAAVAAQYVSNGLLPSKVVKVLP